MNCTSTAEIGFIAVMVIGVGGLVFDRFVMGRKGIGRITVQYIAVVLVLPLIAILALEGQLDHQTLGTVIGAVVGYTLSGLGPQDRDDSK